MLKTYDVSVLEQNIVSVAKTFVCEDERLEIILPVACGAPQRYWLSPQKKWSRTEVACHESCLTRRVKEMQTTGRSMWVLPNMIFYQVRRQIESSMQVLCRRGLSKRWCLLPLGPRMVKYSRLDLEWWSSIFGVMRLRPGKTTDKTDRKKNAPGKQKLCKGRYSCRHITIYQDNIEHPKNCVQLLSPVHAVRWCKPSDSTIVVWIAPSVAEVCLIEICPPSARTIPLQHCPHVIVGLQPIRQWEWSLYEESVNSEWGNF